MAGEGKRCEFRKWFTGSIRRKLTFFVILVCLLLIGLFWVFAVRLLEPAYNASIRNDLSRTVEVFVEVLDGAEEKEVPLVADYITPQGVVTGLSPECLALLNKEIEAGRLQIDHLCIDISGQDLRNLFLQDGLSSRCALHEGTGMLGEAAGPDNDTVMYLRQGVFESGGCFHKTPVQMVMGQTTTSGNLAIIISANLERVPQATKVLSELMFFVALLLIVISIVCALVFSRWFTKPLTKLSTATQEITKGNYEARVQVKGCDEIARLSEDFNQMAEEIGKSYELQRDLYANVSHDLRTPLTLIKGYAETLRDLSGDDPQKRQEQLNVIIDESNRLSALVGNVLELSRVSSGVQKPEPVLFNLTQLCEEVGERYEDAGKQDNYHFVFEGKEPLDIEADPGLLQRALHNLLGNALKHVGDDGYLGLRVFRTPDQTARVEIIDHGLGISEQDLPHLFDKYYRSRADAGKPGTGLGLSITKAIFIASGFAYGVQSEEGKGALFWFEAPLVKP
ncbi:HAMP domain-containing histidine kinase [Ruminococcaceae bacterium OttesenSCG-928-I18]|nr:HAMP domain-containing histidine kinase [Ruminococcaceae bacterium OttesenSCG-928-I18]